MTPSGFVPPRKRDGRLFYVRSVRNATKVQHSLSSEVSLLKPSQDCLLFPHHLPLFSPYTQHFHSVAVSHAPSFHEYQRSSNYIAQQRSSTCLDTSVSLHLLSFHPPVSLSITIPCFAHIETTRAFSQNHVLYPSIYPLSPSPSPSSLPFPKPKPQHHAPKKCASKSTNTAPPAPTPTT
jgi:hypothetical protein